LGVEAGPPGLGLELGPSVREGGGERLADPVAGLADDPPPLAVQAAELRLHAGEVRALAEQVGIEGPQVVEAGGGRDLRRGGRFVGGERRGQGVVGHGRVMLPAGGQAPPIGSWTASKARVGSVNRKVLPAPSSDAAVRCPPWASTRPWLIQRPRPVPLGRPWSRR